MVDRGSSIPNYTVQTKIQRPVADVFQAIVSSGEIVQYFTEQASGPLEEGAEVVWSWSQWGEFPVQVTRIVEGELIELELDSTVWKKTTGPGYKVTVTIKLEPLDDGSTMLSISETGWKIDAEGLKGSHDNCSGWTHMAVCLRAYLERGLDLR